MTCTGAPTCGACGLPIHKNEIGLRHRGGNTLHSESRCIELLQHQLHIAQSGPLPTASHSRDLPVTPASQDYGHLAGDKPAPIEPAPEPVAWDVWWHDHGRHNAAHEPVTDERVKELMKLAFEVGRESVPVAQRAPLTDEEIHACFQQRSRDKVIERRLITRAIERAHKI